MEPASAQSSRVAALTLELEQEPSAHNRAMYSGDEDADWTPDAEKSETHALLPHHRGTRIAAVSGRWRKRWSRHARMCLLGAVTAAMLTLLISLLSGDVKAIAHRLALSFSSARPSPYITKAQDGQIVDLTSPEAVRASRQASRFSLPEGYKRPVALERVAEKAVILYQTGYSVLHARLPVLLLAEPEIPARPYRRFFSDAETQLGPLWFRNILEDWPPEVQKRPEFDVYRAQQDAIGLGQPALPFEQGIWRLSGFKNLPMHQAAYHDLPDAEWQITVDDDTFLFVENVLRYLAMQNSTNLLYLGRSDHTNSGSPTARLYTNGTLYWAQGGSGYALSKSLLDLMLKNDTKYYTEGEGQRYSIEERGGDVATGRAIADVTEGAILGPNGGQKLFFSDQIRTVPYKAETWFDPVMSFHHLSPVEIQGLRKSEARILSRLQRTLRLPLAEGETDDPRAVRYATDGDFIRQCDLAQELLPEALKRALSKYRQYPQGTPNTLRMPKMQVAVFSPVAFPKNWAKKGEKYDAECCARLCQERKNCYGWQWREEDVCALQLNSWGVPRATKDAKLVSGIRLDRISQFLTHHDCDDYRLRTAGDAALVVPRLDRYPLISP